MDDGSTYQGQDAQPLQVVTVEDASQVLANDAAAINDGFAALQGQIQDLALVAQDTQTSAGTVSIDSAQWDDLAAEVSRISSISSASLFLSLVMVCVMSAVLGTHLWRELVAGWRR